ncbi:hypothetical protein LEP1GSC061_4094 [Leptospira wolffii serovar Khorat str. Khorat-H2]|nr:hypothetical protein LEP1GSC061_4094 [Leptospira wolffii serovar Khorat str. Khorat-H2]
MIFAFLPSCFIAPTNERTACVYDLKEKSTLAGSCNFAAFAYGYYSNPNLSPAEKEQAGLRLNFEILECLKYQEKLQDCHKEMNYYIPTLHPE